jgi:hypothetical protein
VKIISKGKEVDMEAEITFEELAVSGVEPAPQDPTSHALVQNPFAWDEEE